MIDDDMYGGLVWHCYGLKKHFNILHWLKDLWSSSRMILDAAWKWEEARDTQNAIQF
jgi:hypothetical protein